MSTAVVHYAAAAASDRGRKRPANEDAFGFSIRSGVYALCDGMGGAAAGEVASSLAVDEILRLLGDDVLPQPAHELAEDAIASANRVIYTRAQRNPKLAGMGTTLVLLITNESQAWLFNVGDSRAYRLRERQLQQITLDHSLVEEQVRLGRMTPAEALRSPLRNVITRALGTHENVPIDVFPLDVEPNDLFLLCSDGLTRELSDDLIASLLQLDLPLQELCERLVHAANKAGGHDNITCLLVRAES